MSEAQKGPLGPPKTSIFDKTLPGTQVPEVTEAPTVAEGLAAPVGLPKTSIFDKTLPGVEGTVPVSVPPASAGPDLLDEGTAAEWNPKWGNPAGVGIEPQTPSSQAERWPYVVGAAVLLLIAGAWWAFRAARPKPSASIPRAETAAAVVMSPDMKAYHDRAEAGDVNAMRLMGLSYGYGLGVPVDQAKGIAWLRRAAKAGNQVALEELKALGGTLEP